jgi:hypothetical protein
MQAATIRKHRVDKGSIGQRRRHAVRNLGGPAGCAKHRDRTSTRPTGRSNRGPHHPTTTPNRPTVTAGPNCWPLVGAVRQLAYDPRLADSDRARRIRDAFAEYDEGENREQHRWRLRGQLRPQPCPALRLRNLPRLLDRPATTALRPGRVHRPSTSCGTGSAFSRPHQAVEVNALGT